MSAERLSAGSRVRGTVAAAVAIALVTAGCSSRQSGNATGNAAEQSETTLETSSRSAGCTAAQPVSAGTSAKVFSGPAGDRTYLLSIPPDYDGTVPVPLILNLHGAGGTGAKVDATSNLPAEAGERGYIVVAPDALSATIDTGSKVIEGGIWDISGSFTDPVAEGTTSATVVEAQLGGDDDVAFLNALLDGLEDQLCVDPTREYAAGKSNGAGMSTWLACQPIPRFAAVAPVSGVNMAKFCPGEHVPPLITFHGDADVPMPYQGGTVVGIELGVPDVDTRMAEMAGKEHCSGSTDTEISTDVVHRVWDCPPGSALELYKVLGGGHTWPGEDPAGASGLGVVTQSIDATQLMLDFFDSHTSNR